MLINALIQGLVYSEVGIFLGLPVLRDKSEILCIYINSLDIYIKTSKS